MECGEALWCQGLIWLTENDETARKLIEFLVGAGGHALMVPGKVLDAAREHLGNLVALAAFSWGVWKWYVYRNRILHERLVEYLNVSDRRLIDGQSYVLDALFRPAPGQKFKLPLFAPAPLRSVLSEKQWNRGPVVANVMRCADSQLAESVEQIAQQLEMARRAAASLQQQMATANILRGAIASASASRSEKPNQARSLVALSYFRAALNVPEHDTDVVAKELEAHQLRKLGHLEQALAAYEEVEQLAPKFGDHKTQRMTLARAKRYQAEIWQALAYGLQDNGTLGFSGTRTGYDLLTPNGAQDTAQKIRARFGPFEDWDQLEQADLHYLTAFLAKNLGYGSQEAVQLTLAQSAYSAVADHKPRHWWRRDRTTSMKRLAIAGEKRVEAAQSSGKYDESWLLPPPLDKTHN